MIQNNYYKYQNKNCIKRRDNCSANQIQAIYIPEDKIEYYFITTVHRTKYRTYLGTKQCIERNYEVTREEGNQLYADIKCGKTILIPEE